MKDESKKTATYRKGEPKADEKKIEEVKDEGLKADASAINAALNASAEEGKAKGAERKSEQVVVSKDDLQVFLRRLESLEQDNRRLLAAADKSRLSAIREQERQGEKQRSRVKLTRMGGPAGKMVVAWRMTRNEAYMQGRVLVEHQEIEVFYDDGTSERMPLINFYRGQNKDTVAEIMSRTKREDSDDETLTVRILGEDAEMDINLKFVN